MSYAPKFINMRNEYQKINRQFINPYNTHSAFHQKVDSNLSQKYNLNSGKKIDFNENIPQVISNSFYMTPHNNNNINKRNLVNNQYINNKNRNSINNQLYNNNMNNMNNMNNINNINSINNQYINNNIRNTVNNQYNSNIINNNQMNNKYNNNIINNNINSNSSKKEKFNKNINKNLVNNINYMRNDYNTYNENIMNQSAYTLGYNYIPNVNKNKMNDEQIKNYIIYLKNHLNSSYYANNDLNNEYNKIMTKSKQINDSINNKNDIFINMNKSFEEKLEKNKNYKKDYINLVDEYKLNHKNEQIKLKELNQIINVQDNDILRLENENNLLNEDISNKKTIIENLKKQINILKNKKSIIEANEEYINLFNKKNHLISLSQKIKIIKRIKAKNNELIQNINNLKNYIHEKENIIIESHNIQNDLNNKLIQLMQEDENNKKNRKNKKINTNTNINININNNLNNNINNKQYSKNRIDEAENENSDGSADGDLQGLYSPKNENNEEQTENADENDSVEYYQKLIDDENKKGEEIKEKLLLYNNEISNIKKDIYSIKSKNNEEISSYKQFINNLSPNDEEIKNKLILNKKDILNQKENLILYNQKFKNSLSEKNDLVNKIKSLQIENKNIELKLNEKQKSIGFKIKAIKIRRGEGKNKNNLTMERNLSDPDLIKNNKNDKLYISQNRENFIPMNEVYRYKRFEYKFKNEKKLLNRFRSRKSGSFDNIFKYNTNNKIEQESNIDILNTPRTGTYLYTIDKEGKLLGYGISLKKYVYINTSSIKGWKLFYKEYKNNANGSLLLNTLAGLFILTGDNYNHLYYYSQSKNVIYLLMILKYNHKYGGLMLTKDNNKIIIIGGIFTKEVELFDIQRNNLKNLPSLLTKRINSSFNIIDNNYLVAFFGRNNNTIEYLDLNNMKKWEVLEYKSNDKIKELSGHIGFHVNKNIVIIVGGENNDKIMIFYFREKYVDVTDFILDFDADCGIDDLFFDKEKCFNVVENKEKTSADGKIIKEIMGMDIFGNVHCFDNDYAYTIFVF